MIKLSNGSSARGAQMGRPEIHLADTGAAMEFELERLPMVDGCYDAEGAYWGAPDNLYCAQSEDDGETVVQMFIRADSREDAEAKVKETYPNVTFKEPEMSAFLEGYMTAALWSTSTEDGGNLDDDHDITDIAPECFKAMKSTCEDFQKANAVYLAQAYKGCGHGGYGEAQAGQDFWLTRCGHGTGFWDRGLKAAGEMLSEAARVYGNVDLYVRHDGKICGETE